MHVTTPSPDTHRNFTMTTTDMTHSLFYFRLRLFILTKLLVRQERAPLVRGQSQTELVTELSAGNQLQLLLMHISHRTNHGGTDSLL